MLRVSRIIVRQEARHQAALAKSEAILGPTAVRSYVSRAHPTSIPEYPITSALEMVLTETHERLAKRSEKWERNKPARSKKGIQVG